MERDVLWRWQAWARGEWTMHDFNDLNGWANEVYSATHPAPEVPDEG